MQKLSTIQKNLIKVSLLFICTFSLSSFAEKADRNKSINVESDKMTADDNKKISYFDGHVILTQGTIRLTAEHMVVREDKDGFKYASAFGDPVTFRQKKEAANQWVDGVAQHAEYDDKIGRVELFEKAIVRQDKDEIKGNYLSYDLNSEFLQAEGKNKNAPNTSKGRVHMIFKPEDKTDNHSFNGNPTAPVLKIDKGNAR